MKTPFYLFILLMSILITSCQTPKDFDLQGHRGARGLMPENTWPAFEKALDLGVNTLEMDVVISKDGKVVVSHEPWFNPAICLMPNGQPIAADERISLYQLNYNEIATYDCGSLGNPRFPEQQKLKTGKPLLQDILDKAELYARKYHKKPVSFNIEIKSEAGLEGSFQPEVEAFSDLVYEVVSLLPRERLTLQSFDFRVLQYFHKKYPDIRLAALVEEPITAAQALEKLGFKPDIYSPEHVLLNPDEINFLHAQNIQVIPWTVNETADMEKLLAWGVDGLITDYPDRALVFKKEASQ